MKESVAIAKGADRKKDFLPTKSDNGIHHVQHEPERQLGSLRSVINTIRSDGGTPSVESIATELSSMHNAERAPVLLALQRTHGNRYVQRVAAGIQAKLAVGQPGDIYEQEADRVAEQVMRIPEPQVQRQAEEEEKKEEEEEEELIQTKPLAEQITQLVQMQVEEEEEKKKEEEEVLQTKEAPAQTPDVTPNLEARISAMRGDGQPLSESVRAYFEPRFGYDFSQVRVHTDARAAESARVVNARAFTIGRNVTFGSGEYQPETAKSRRLLAHELTHVLQQSGQAGDFVPFTTKATRFSHNFDKLSISHRDNTVLARFPSPPDCHTFKPGLSYMKPIVKEGYDGTTYTAIKTGWKKNSWRRRWQIYDAEDKLMYESYYILPQPTLYIPKDVVAKGKAGGKKKPWSVWIKVTHTLVPFGGSDPKNFPHSYMKFYVYDTWNEFMEDPAAKLSDIKQQPGQGAGISKPKVLESTAVSGARSVTDYGSVVAMHEAYLREIYDNSTKGITETAKQMVGKDVPQGDAAKWAVNARNQLKAKIRTDGNPILKKVFEARNLKAYQNKLGPSYEKLYTKYAKQGLSPEEINSKIIRGSGKPNIKINRWAGRLKVAGRIMIAIDIALAGVKVALAPEGERVKVGLQEVARIAGALALGAVGVKAGAAAGAAIGVLFGGAGAVPGAIIGGIIGGIGGALFGGLLGKSLVQKIYDMFPPSECVFEGEFKEEVR
nr:hypothetical membrane protein [uncultured archaeon]